MAPLQSQSPTRRPRSLPAAACVSARVRAGPDGCLDRPLAQITIVVGAAVPEQRAHQGWAEGLAVLGTALIVVFLGEGGEGGGAARGEGEGAPPGVGGGGGSGGQCATASLRCIAHCWITAFPRRLCLYRSTLSIDQRWGRQGGAACRGAEVENGFSTLIAMPGAVAAVAVVDLPYLCCCARACARALPSSSSSCIPPPAACVAARCIGARTHDAPQSLGRSRCCITSSLHKPPPMPAPAACAAAGQDYSKELQFQKLNALKDVVEVKVTRGGKQVRARLRACRRHRRHARTHAAASQPHCKGCTQVPRKGVRHVQCAAGACGRALQLCAMCRRASAVAAVRLRRSVQQ